MSKSAGMQPPGRRWHRDIRLRLALPGLGLAVALAAAVRADDPPLVSPGGRPDPVRSGRERPGAEPELGPAPASEAHPAAEAEERAMPGSEEAGAAGEGDVAGRGREKEGEERGPLDPFFEVIDPAKFQRGLDRFLQARIERERPERFYPKVPEIGEPVFFDQVRPLGSKKYSNEFNYLLNPSTRNAPTMQVLEYEYAFADWKAAELDLSYFNGNLEIITPFYQQTLGVGRQGRSVRGFQLSPDIYIRSGFVGGSATYLYGWKPTVESRFSTLTFIGANRQLIGGFQFPAAPGSRLGSAATRAGTGDDKVYGAWRPTLNINLFYKLAEKFSLGLENDLFFQSGRAGEYICFPFVTWEAGKHAFFQVGGGYYHFESRDQFTFLLHLNFVNPSSNRGATQTQGEGPTRSDEDAGGVDAPRGGPIRRWIGRRRAGG